jgi:hypothetical protein
MQSKKLLLKIWSNPSQFDEAYAEQNGKYCQKSLLNW